MGEVYNVGGHNERTNLEVVMTIMRALNISENQLSFVEDRLGHDQRYAIDPTKIKQKLGWKPECAFETGLVDTIAWYIGHQDWWRLLKVKLA